MPFQTATPAYESWSLYTSDGRRKYVNADDQSRFLAVARNQDIRTETLCLLLLYTGCRLSEALSLRA